MTDLNERLNQHLKVLMDNEEFTQDLEDEGWDEMTPNRLRIIKAWMEEGAIVCSEAITAGVQERFKTKNLSGILGLLGGK